MLSGTAPRCQDIALRWGAACAVPFVETGWPMGGNVHDNDLSTDANRGVPVRVTARRPVGSTKRALDPHRNTRADRPSQTGSPP